MTERVVKQADEVRLIVYACEAGMGSSLMGANQLKKMIKKAKLDIQVVHSPVSQISPEADVVLTHQKLAATAKARVPGAAVVPFQMFFNDPSVKAVVEKLKNGEAIESGV